MRAHPDLPESWQPVAALVRLLPVGLTLTALHCMQVLHAADARWVLAARSPSGTLDIYIGSDVMTREGGLVEALELWDFSTPRRDATLKISYRSRVWHTSTNCNDLSTATFSVTYFADSMGRGAKMYESPKQPDAIRYVRPAPDSAGATMLRTICASTQKKSN